MPGYALLVDEGHRAMLANRAVLQAASVDAGALEGASCSQAIHGQASFPACPMDEALASADGRACREHFDAKTGRWLLLSLDPTALVTEDGQRILLHTVRDVSERKRAQLGLEHALDTQRALADVLRLSLEGMSLDAFLGGALDVALSIPWLALEHAGAMFLLDEPRGLLELRAHRNLSPPLVAACGSLPLGRCLCGRAGASGATVVATHVDERHEIAFDGIHDHGHVCTPIRYEEQTLGVMNTYLRAGFSPSAEQVGVLELIAAAVAGAIARRRAEGEQTRLADQLAHSQRLEAMGRLAGGVAHDFNNLLTLVFGGAQFLMDELAPDDPRAEDVRDILAAAERATVLTRQLLAFSRKEVVRPRVLCLNDVVRGVERMLRRAVTERVALELRLAPELWNVRVDPGQLEQVLVNLAVNARDAMPSGGTLLVETANVPAPVVGSTLLLAATPSGWARLRVSDTGAGMPPEVARQVFEPFFTTKVAGRGTGLGLATVYGIVKQAGGEITVDSTVGQGTAMTIDLPATRDMPTRPSREPQNAPLELAGLTVLLVEDDQCVRSVLHRQMNRHGIRVLEASGPAEALDLCRERPGAIGVLVTDLVMPSMSGVELAATISASRPEMRTLFISGYADEALLAGPECVQARLLLKPFSEAALIAAIAAAVAE